MKRRSGFTLMELLLVVAVLAIVAAAAAPTFFGGASDAMKEARKASVAAAYSNVVSNASVQVGIKKAQGVSDPDILSAIKAISQTASSPADVSKAIIFTPDAFDNDGITVKVTGDGAPTDTTIEPNTYQAWANGL